MPNNLKTPLRDGDDERPDDEAYAGSYFFNANCVGYAIKQSLDFISNKYIPLIMLVLGTILGIVSSGLSLESILSGMVSGLASTGLYEAFRNLINKEIR